MKTTKAFSILIICISVVLISCGGSETKTNNEGTTSEAPAADPSTLETKEVIINTSGNTMAEMKYDITEFRAIAGQKVSVTLNNKSTDEAMQHNIVIVKAGTAETVAIAGMKEGLSKNFTPSSTDVIAGSAMIGPGKSTTFEFVAPLEKGEYDFICTYPGHWSTMKGKFIVE